MDIVSFYGDSRAIRVPKILSHFKHYLIIGSIAQHANKNSVLLGAGFIEPNNTEDTPTFGTVKVVRGEITREVVRNKRENPRDDILLGDPGLLISKVYGDVERSSEFEFGLVLHVSEADSELEEIAQKMGGKLIRVSQSPKDFAREISRCKRILSSSLHGIIFSDAFKIPNARIKLTNRVVGADYKFSDYYSTTNRPSDDFVDFRNSSKEKCLISSLSRCSVAEYRFSLCDIESCISDSLRP
ncbi:polysaccharide pyruvyl transferase family protein [Henriciella marina]|uniref:polysaccharide pyruvyl transferase family protein n=1 Tax=Henriciella marina TaxID=453851 RepID=UPI0014615FF1|nr:polysaccharide pyruvyl transferase family protein [Henriciella marina]